jgi:hypothetical protein
MIPVVAIKNLLPFVCFDIHLNAEISVYVQPPKKKTTVVVLSFLPADNQYLQIDQLRMTHPALAAYLLSV